MLDNNDVVPHRGVRRVCISGRNISFDSVRTNFFNVNELEVGPDSSRFQRALINIRRLCVVNVVDGLEYLLDGFMLPHLKYIYATTLTLFVTFARQSNPMKSLDSVEQLVIYNQLGQNKICTFTSSIYPTNDSITSHFIFSWFHQLRR